MPSINRLVLLAVLSLSAYVQSAPVPDAAGAALARAIVVSERDVVAVREPEFNDDVEELFARVFDDEDVDEDEDDDDQDVDDDEFDLEEREFEDIEARAKKTAAKPVKAAPKPAKAAPVKAAPKPVKAAPKPVKAAPKPVKAAPKPVKAAPVKAAPKPVKAAPVKAAPKPVKAAPKPVKAAPKPVKAAPVKAAPKSVKAAPKASKSAKAPAASKSAAACAIKKRADKHFTKADAPASLSVEIQGQTFKLTKSSSQGNNAVVYRDAAGDFAKTPLTGTLAKEAAFTKEVGQLKAAGDDTCTGTEWMITTAAQGKVLNETPAFIAAKAAGKEQCQELAATAATLAVAKAKSIFDAAATKGISHGDLNAGNIFFDDQVTQVLTLIDWGSASKRSSFPNLVAKGQASTSFNALC